MRKVVFILLLTLISFFSYSQDPKIINSQGNAYIDNSTFFMNIYVDDESKINNMFFVYFNITDANKEEIRYEVPRVSENRYLIDLEGMEDDIGIQYYIEIITTDGKSIITNNEILSDNEIVYRNFPNGVTLGFFPAWNGEEGNTAAYRIITAPLRPEGEPEKLLVKNIFEEAGLMSDSTYKLFNFDVSLASKNPYVKLDEDASITPGEPLWFISSKDVSIGTPNGSTQSVLFLSIDQPYTFELKQGWNMIGNPYVFDLKWNSIRNYNSTIDLGNEFISFDGSYVPTNTIKKFSGGWIFNHDLPRTLEIPTAKNLNGGSRLADETSPLTNPIDSKKWLILFYSTLNNKKQELGGIGMHPEANKSKDKFDRMTLPRFINYVEMNFHHPEYFYPNFSKDIVNSQDSYTWDFEFETNEAEVSKTIKWDNSYFGNNNKTLYLYDIKEDIFIDMKMLSSYSFEISNKRKFKIYYGDKLELDKTLFPENIKVYSAYPNPFSNSITFSFDLPKSDLEYKVVLEVYDISGRKIQTAINNYFKEGLHQKLWNAIDGKGSKLSEGIYFYKLYISNRDIQKNFIKKIILE